MKETGQRAVFSFALHFMARYVHLAAMNCIFCQIVNRQKQAKVYFEDEEIIVFADILPKAEIHLLVLPKAHYPDLQDIPDDLLLKLFVRIRAMAAELGIEDNYRLQLNNGPKSGQIIPHIHFHFLSNEPGVKLRLEQR